MKFQKSFNLFLLLFVTFLLTANLYGQVNFYDEQKGTKVSNDHKGKSDKIKKKDGFDKKADPIFVKFNDIRKIQKKGKLKIIIPGTNKNVGFHVSWLENRKDGSFIWNGKVDTSDGDGYINLYFNNGEYRGNLVYENDKYEIIPLSDQVHLFAKKDSILLFKCDVDVEPIRPKLQEKVLMTREVNVCQNREAVRVLCLFSTNAKNNPLVNGNMAGYATARLNFFNQVMVNSSINKPGLVLAGAVELPFTESIKNSSTSVPIRSDLFKFAINPATPTENAPIIVNLRNQYQADFICIFTDPINSNVRDYSGGASGISLGGQSNNIPFVIGQPIPFIPGKENAMMIMMVDFTDNVFTHEVGHIFGFAHQRCSQFSSVVNKGFGCQPDDPASTLNTDNKNYPHNFTYSRWLKSHDCITMMFSGSSTGERIMFFSNPLVSHWGKPTGTSQNNNAGLMTTHYNSFANLVPYSDASAYIEGPYIVCPGQTDIYSAIVNCASQGSTVYTDWDISTDGINYTYLGGSPTIPITVGYQPAYLHLTVTIYPPNGLPTSTESSYTILPECGTYYLQKPPVEERITSLKVNVYPNPTRELLAIDFNLDNTELVDIDLVSSSGVSIRKEKRIVIEKGNKTINFNINDIPNGIYMLNLSIGKDVITKKVSIIH